jgi:uncharacterized protein YcgL (UPF0745 family)
MNTDCVVYRCGKQDEMYLYLRAGVKPDDLPTALLRRVGKLTQVMQLSLAPGRKLARVDVDKVLEKLHEPGYYLQMPPQGHIKGNLYFGD